jgi:sulfate adenylyltransferase
VSRSGAAPAVVMSDRTLGDLELILLGVLPSTHHLGGEIFSPTGGSGIRRRDSAHTNGADHPVTSETQTVVTLTDEQADAALAADRLLLLDHESTPLAALTGLVEVPPNGESTLGRRISGSLLRERHRESGLGRAQPLSAADLARQWSRLIVFARPMTKADQPPQSADEGGTLLVVPDVAESTDGVPTGIMVGLAHEFAARRDDVEVRSVPLRWRQANSDRALVAMLAMALGNVPVTVLHGDPALDDNAEVWAAAKRHLDTAVDLSPSDHLSADTSQALTRWRKPRPQRGVVLLFTGLSGSGKSTLARTLYDRVQRESQRTVSLLDGDVVRQLLSAGLGFDRASRMMNVRRIGYVAAEVARHGGVAVCAPIAPHEVVRQEVRRMVSHVGGDFLLVHVSTPLEVCEARDLKGLYAAARAGRLSQFTGVSDPYDVPTDAALDIDTSQVSISDGADIVFGYLADGGWLERKSRGH